MTLMEDMSLEGFHTFGRIGDWEVRPREVTEEEYRRDRLYASLNGHNRFAPPGTYTLLTWGDNAIMSDTPNERADHLEPLVVARSAGRMVQRLGTDSGSRALVHGLGLGVIIKGLLAQPEVAHVDVVERSPEVVMLCASPFAEALANGRLTIHVGDCFKLRWPKGSKWDVVWHDIWADITPENLPQMKRLHRKFGRRCEWQGSWARAQCERMGMR